MVKRFGSSNNRIKDKLSSQAGASITFALLLFLVCAALSAVVLVAATTSAGRIKNIAESDQKYYAVMSAAELVNDILDDQTISTIELNESKSYSFSKPMDQINENDIKAKDNINTAISTDSFDSNDEQDEKVSPSASGQSTEPASVEKDTFVKAITAVYNSAEGKGSYDLTFTPLAGSEVTSMKARATAVADKTNGTVTITVSSGENSGGIVMVYSVDTEEKYPPVTQVAEDGVTTRNVTSAYETTWHLLRMGSGIDINGDV